jgi:hypothetical protein
MFESLIGKTVATATERLRILKVLDYVAQERAVGIRNSMVLVLANDNRTFELYGDGKGREVDELGLRLEDAGPDFEHNLFSDYN